jgi:hypothetical protein
MCKLGRGGGDAPLANLVLTVRGRFRGAGFFAIQNACPTHASLGLLDLDAASKLLVLIADELDRLLIG